MPLTDQGPQFEAALSKAFTNLIDCERVRTSAYHPASNGILERWHRTLKSAIMCHSSSNWFEILPTVLLGLRSCFKEDFQASPAEMLYGLTLRLPGEFFTEEDFPSDPEIFLERHRLQMRDIKSQPTAHHHKKTPFHYKNFYDCTFVWVRDDSVWKSLQPPSFGPFRVINRINDYLFAIDIAGKIVNISTERLKPAFLRRELNPDLIASLMSINVYVYDNFAQYFFDSIISDLLSEASQDLQSEEGPIRNLGRRSGGGCTVAALLLRHPCR